jgi:hypothetical protein
MNVATWPAQGAHKSAGLEEILQNKRQMSRNHPAALRSCQRSIVMPFFTTMAPRSFTLASNEITLPSFHISSVMVSPG